MKKIIIVSMIIIIMLTGCNHKKNNITNTINSNERVNNQMIIEVNGKELIINLEDNSSSKALLEKLKESNITVNAKDYGNFEKVGELGFELPRNDNQITTKPGDIILYQGTNICLYYGTNSWNFTKLGSIENVNEKELKSILGTGDVTLVLKLK